MIKNTPNETQKGILEGYGVIPAPGLFFYQCLI